VAGEPEIVVDLTEMEALPRSGEADRLHRSTD
jgi:hypothetical protein